MGYIRLKRRIIRKLETGLSPKLKYHDINHTLDVVACVSRAIARNKLSNQRARLLTIAAYAHDLGFVSTYDGHEEESIKILGPIALEEGYSQKEIDTINSSIRATKIPQTANSLEEKILCDADLDYLGREDAFAISQKLFLEWLAYGRIKNDKNRFDDLQIAFLKSHEYHTAFSRKHRQPRKLNYLNHLELKRQNA